MLPAEGALPAGETFIVSELVGVAEPDGLLGRPFVRFWHSGASMVHDAGRDLLGADPL